MNRRPEDLFRQRALERANRAESFDEHIRIVGAPRWLALAFGLLVVAGLVAWAVSREVETTVDAAGALSAPGFAFVQAPVGGLVVQAPASGAEVSSDTVIAKIDPEAGPDVSVQAFASGTVGAVAARRGSVVAAGDQLAAIEPRSTTTLSAALFVPVSEATGIDPGLEALLTPLASGSQASSQLKGTVREVASTPASPGRLTLLLGPTLGSEVAAGPPVVEVDVALVPDPSTPTGYAWTSGQGPEGALSPATPVSADIVVERQSPLHFLF